MNINEIFPSKYLTASDLNGREPNVTISAVEVLDMENDGRKERKLVATFEKATKQLVLNKTNSRAIADMYGENTDDWIGKAVKLVTARVDFQGRRVSAIRIDPPARGAPVVKEQAPSLPPPVADLGAFDDEVGF